MSPTELLLTPTVKVGGSDLPQTWRNALVELRVDLEYRVPGRCTMRFTDEGYALAASGTMALGAQVEVHVRDKGTLLKGDVTGIAVDQRDGEHPALVVTVHDRAYRLARSTNIGTYVTGSYSTVLTKVAQRHGLTASVTASGEIPYLLQVDSDLAFVDALADRCGVDWWVDDTTLNFKPPDTSAPIALTLGDDLRTLSVRANGIHADTVRIEGWNRKEQQKVSATVSSASSGMTPDVAMLSDYAKPGGKLGGQGELVAAAFGAGTQAEAQAVGQALLDRVVSAAVSARGTTWGHPQMRPGGSVKVSGCGPVSGTYYLTKVEHVYRPTGLETRFVAGDRRPTSLVDTLGATRQQRSGSFDHVGLVVGQVTNIQDPESLGRVKVRFPGLSEQEESDWARVVGVGGGSERGMVFLPEVGDEVLVGFESGDPRQPVVIGGLYGQKSTIPSPGVKEGKVPARRITSRLGHVVELADGSAPADQYILMELAGQQQKFNFAKDKVEMAIPAGVPLTIKVGESSLAFDAQGSLKIKAVNIDIEADGNLTMKSNGPASLKSQANLDLQGQAMASVKGGMVEVNASGVTTVKGAQVMIN